MSLWKKKPPLLLPEERLKAIEKEIVLLKAHKEWATETINWLFKQRSEATAAAIKEKTVILKHIWPSSEGNY